MKNYLKVLSMAVVLLCLAFSDERKMSRKEKELYYFSAQAGVINISGTCITLDRCVGSDLTFIDPDGLLGSAPSGTYGWYVISGMGTTCGIYKLLSWDPLTECP